MTNPTGDALKASAAQVQVKPLEWVSSYGGKWLRAVTPVGIYEVRARDQNVELAKQRCFDKYAEKILSCLSPVEQAPQPVAVVTQPIGFMDVDGLGALVDEVRARPTLTEAPPVESQAAEIARLREAMLDVEWMISTRPVKERGTGQDSHEVERFLSDVCDTLRVARHATSAALAAEGSAE